VDIPSASRPEQRDQYDVQVRREIDCSLQELDDIITFLQAKPAATAPQFFASLARPPEEQPPSSQDDLPVVPLKPQDAAILKVLLAANGVTMTAEALAGKLYLSDKPIREGLQYLRDSGLTETPLGKAGHTLTAKGYARVRDLPADVGKEFLRPLLS
jgi:hypothetical protein